MKILCHQKLNKMKVNISLLSLKTWKRLRSYHWDRKLRLAIRSLRTTESIWKNSKNKKKLQRKNDKTIVSFILQRSKEAGEYLQISGVVYSSVEVEKSLILQYNAGHSISIYP